LLLIDIFIFLDDIQVKSQSNDRCIQDKKDEKVQLAKDKDHRMGLDMVIGRIGRFMITPYKLPKVFCLSEMIYNLHLEHIKTNYRSSKAGDQCVNTHCDLFANVCTLLSSIFCLGVCYQPRNKFRKEAKGLNSHDNICKTISFHALSEINLQGYCHRQIDNEK
jgi:hypothetical protein